MQAPLPVMYPPQAAVVDPTWYYQQMMLYQMSPQSCIPRPQFAGVQQLVHPGAMFSRYAVAPGNTQKHTCVCICTMMKPHIKGKLASTIPVYPKQSFEVPMFMLFINYQSYNGSRVQTKLLNE